jgi:tetratricopeptide (TPR) repeat protein
MQVTDRNFVAYNNLGTVYRGQGRVEDAVANFESAVRIQPESEEAQDNLGEALTTLGKGEDAIPHLLAAIRSARISRSHILIWGRP